MMLNRSAFLSGIGVLILLMGVGIAVAQEREVTIAGREIVERLTRLEEGQKTFNQRLEQGLGAVNQRIDDLKQAMEQNQAATNQRLDAIDKRIGEMQGFLLWGFGITFSGMFALVGFVLWDRRSALSPAIRRLEDLRDRERRLEAALREHARGTLPLDESLRKYDLL